VDKQLGQVGINSMAQASGYVMRRLPLVAAGTRSYELVHSAKERLVWPTADLPVIGALIRRVGLMLGHGLDRVVITCEDDREHHSD